MSVCPNVNTPEWKKLEASVGKFEAFKDFMESGDIRTPEQVKEKILSRESKESVERTFGGEFDALSSEPTLAELAEKTHLPEGPYLGIDAEQLKNGRAIELANKMSAALGIPYEAITSTQAIEVTKNATNPWAGEAAFFVGGTVYFVNDKMSTDLVLHEFSHPLVRAISTENEVLFNNLYNQVAKTVEGREVIDEVRKTHSHLLEDSKLFKEEVIVQALEKAGLQKLSNEKVETPFNKAIKNILYNIKQLLRKYFGRSIKVSGINENTSIDQLADILTAGDAINIDTELVSQEEIVAYSKKALKEVNEDLNKVRNADILKTVNTFYSATEEINTLLRNENYEELAKLFVDPNKRAQFDEIRSDLVKWQTTIKGSSESLRDDMVESGKRVEALANSLVKLENVMQKMYEHTEELSKRPDTQENMHQARYYEKFVNHWTDFIAQVDKAVTAKENGVASTSPVISLVNGINTNLKKTKSLIDEMYADGARDTLYEQLEPLNRSITARYESMLAEMEEKGAPQSRKDAIFKQLHGMNQAEYKRYNALVKNKKNLSVTEEEELNTLSMKSKNGVSITKDKIELLMKGQMGDANWFNSYLEGYLYNTDPIIGGLALYVKNAMNEVMIVTMQKDNAFKEDMKDSLIKAGYNPSKVGDLGKRTLFRDAIVRRNPDTDEWERAEVLTFLNEWKEYRYDEGMLKKAVEDAHIKYTRETNDVNHKEFVAAKIAYNKWRMDYMHQEYVEEFYERKKLFDQDEIGIEAAAFRDELFERMRLINESNKSEMDLQDVSENIDELWREYRMKHQIHDEFGKEKTGREALIAQRLRDYRDASRDFYEWKIRKGAFENTYINFQQELINAGVVEDMTEGSDWRVRMDQWKKRNTRSVVKQEFYDERDRILKDIKAIMLKLESAKEREELDQSALWKRINDLMSSYRDDDNQPNGAEMTEESIAKIKQLQLELQDIKEAGVKRSGLTQIETNELSELYEKKKEQGGLSGTDDARLKELYFKKKELGLSKKDSALLNNLYAQLGSMSTKEATDYYVDIINNWMGQLDVSTFEEQFKDSNVDKITADHLLVKETADALMEQSPEFADWFNANHIVKTTWEKQSDGSYDSVDRYERLHVWSVTKPSDPNMMESYEVKDINGKIIDTVQGLPALRHYSRVVKTKYRSRNVEGVTKDNQGHFLPKKNAVDDRYVNQEYFDLQKNDPDLFVVLEKLKKHHLLNQEGLAYSSRLGLDAPRFEKEFLESAQEFTAEKGKEKVNAFSNWVKRVREFFSNEATANTAEGLNHEDRFNLVRADLFDNEVTDVPIAGLYNIRVDDVSEDIMHSMSRYMLSAQQQKQKIKMSPVARAIQSTVSHPDNAIKDLNSVHKKNFLNTHIIKYLPKKDNIRRDAINNFIEREFKGQSQANEISNIPWLNNFAGLLFKRASFSFFALNIPSALKNSLGMKFQAMIEASGGKYVDHKNLQKGNVWAYKAMGELSFGGELYKKGAKSHTQQLIDQFDAIQGRFDENLGREMSRSALKDVVEMSWLYSPRKWVEIQAGLQLFAGIMHKKKVDVLMPDGSTKKIDYINAWETVDGQIRLKEGIDVRYNNRQTVYSIGVNDTMESIAQKHNMPVEEVMKAFKGESISSKLDVVTSLEKARAEELTEVNKEMEANAGDPETITKLMDKVDVINKNYDAKVLDKGSITINNSEFKFMKNQMHQIQNNMGGAYAKFDQPEMQRHIWFRFISYMRRYFTTMATNRWGFSGKYNDPRPRLNPGLGDVQMGFYIQFGKTMVDTLRNGGSNLPFLTADEKYAAIKFGSEVAFLLTTTMLMGVLFGWDPEDEERYAKLRAKSGALPIPGTADDPSRPDFDLLGFSEVQALHLLMQVRAENEQFNLLTGGITQYNSLLDIKSVAFGPTTDSYVQMWDDAKKWATNDPKASYSRKVGPYEWQQQGGSKFINHFAKTFGLTGSSLDPSLAVQNFQSFQSKVRR